MYPKDFFDRTQLVHEPGSCFLVMPFAPKFDAVFRLIKGVLEDELGLSCVRTDELLGGGHIIEDILRGLATSELVVVDVTGRNPNVFYELGIAHMCKQVEQVILLSQEIDSIPFDLRPFRHIVYRSSAAGLRELATALRRAVGAVSEKVHRIVLDEQLHGELPDRLMGKDHCLYAFKVNDTFFGHNSAKVRLAVTRYVMGDGHGRQSGSPKLQSKCIFNGGLGLRLGEPKLIYGTEWSILLERAPDREPCFRIVQTGASALLSRTGRMPVNTKASSQLAAKRAKKNTTCSRPASPANKRQR